MRSLRDKDIVRALLILAGLLIVFLAGLFPFEELLTYVPSPAQLTASVVPAEVATLTNQNREDKGLPPLAVSPLLTEAAQMKADDMARNSYYAHVSPDGKSPLYWLNKAGYRYLNAGENLVIDRDTSEQAVDAWMHSADHRENILRPQFTEIGVGVAKGEYEGVKTIFVVEEFGTPYPLSSPKPVAVTARKAVTAVVEAEKETAKQVDQAKTVTSVVAPALAAPTLVVPAILSNAVTLAKPVLTSAVPGSAPLPATTTEAATAATSTEATSSLTFTLAPAFYAPVSLSASQTDLQADREEGGRAARPQLLERFGLYLSRLSTFLKDTL
jgi:uncharacterized protein YkwD